MYQHPKLKVFLAGLLVFPALATFVSIHLVAQEKPPSPFPVAEMQRLSKLYIGRWEYTETYPKSAFFPSGGVNTGVYVSEPGPGGNSIFNHFHSKGAEGDFEGTLVMTWDPLERAYKAYVFGDSFPGAIVQTGQWEGDTLIFKLEFSAGGKKIVQRNVTKFLDGGKLTSDQFASVEGKPETLLVHVEAVKK